MVAMGGAAHVGVGKHAEAWLLRATYPQRHLVSIPKTASMRNPLEIKIG